jgi:hypothetical protein
MHLPAPFLVASLDLGQAQDPTSWPTSASDLTPHQMIR